jgi:hypothetical protein
MTDRQNRISEIELLLEKVKIGEPMNVGLLLQLVRSTARGVLYLLRERDD